jgi:hypothetical protein
MRTTYIKILVLILIVGCIEEVETPPIRTYYLKVIDAINFRPIEGAIIEIVPCSINVGPIGPPCCRMGGLNDNTTYSTNSQGFAKINGLINWDEECQISHPDYLQRICEWNFSTSNCWEKLIDSNDTASIAVFGLYPKADIKFTYKGNFNLPDSFRTSVSGSTLIQGLEEKCFKSMDMDFDPTFTKVDNNRRIIFRANRDTTFYVYVVAEKMLDLNFGYYVNRDQIQIDQPIYRKNLSVSVPRNTITIIEIPAFD